MGDFILSLSKEGQGEGKLGHMLRMFPQPPGDSPPKTSTLAAPGV